MSISTEYLKERRKNLLMNGLVILTLNLFALVIEGHVLTMYETVVVFLLATISDAVLMVAYTARLTRPPTACDVPESKKD